MNALDLYAKIEPLIGFYDEYEELYSSYLEILSSLHVKSILDIGCGNGKLLKHLENSHFSACGIDRSKEMINRATRLGVKASTQELSDFKENSFDCMLAVADVLNYINKKDLCQFFQSASKALKNGGYFICDINTLEGFDVTDGIMIRDDIDKFLSIEANFEDEILTTNITFFEQKNDKYTKFSNTIYQYYHHLDFFKNMKEMQLIDIFDISMFSEKSDKTILLFKNV